MQKNDGIAYHRIAIDAGVFLDTEKTGIGKYAVNLTDALMERAGASRFLLRYFSLHRSPEQLKIMKCYGIGGAQLDACGFFVQRIYKAIWRVLPIPYHCFFPKNADLSVFFNYCIPPGVRGRKVAFVYDMVYKRYPETMHWRTKAMLEANMKQTCKRADLIVTISAFSKGEISRFLGYRQDRIIVVPCGVDFRMYHPHYSEEQKHCARQKYGIQGEYILYLGTLEPRKNIPRLIGAYQILRKADPAVPELVIAGKKGWQYQEIFALVKELGLADHVLFPGYIDEADVPLLMAGAKVFVFPSLYEGFGMPPLEAMACGTPVLVSKTAALPEVVGDAGVMVDPLSPNSIAQGMEQLLTDEAYRQSMIKKGIARAAFFSWEAAADIFLKNVFAQDSFYNREV